MQIYLARQLDIHRSPFAIHLSEPGPVTRNSAQFKAIESYIIGCNIVKSHLVE